MRALFMILLVILTSCSQNHRPVLEQEMPKDIEVFFCPEDDCLGELISLTAKSSNVDCALYNVDIPELLDALEGQNARLITDKDNEKKLEGTKLDYRSNYGAQLMHNKFCILDNKTVITGSYNPTVRGAKDDNNMLVINSKELAANYRDEFEEMWLGWFEGGNKVQNQIVNVSGTIVQNYFCPEDCKYEAIAAVLNSINNAKESIYFMTFSFTDDNIGDAIIDKHREGVYVAGIF
ncbi:MAG: phospholipase D-like domain-containing protein, partial [Candidatus Woesearchaeota archaeon]